MDTGAASPSALARLILSIVQTQLKKHLEQQQSINDNEQNILGLNTTQETST
jgi:DNA-binding FrmR family transcriptional regulator